MNARYQIFHDTCYHYDSPVSLAQQLAHLWPRECGWQRCTEQQLLISPDPTARRDELDVFGNPLTRLAFERPHDELQVNAQLTVEVLARPVLDFNQSPAWEQTRDALTYSSQPLSADVLEACRYRFQSPYVHLKSSFVEFSQSCFPLGRPLLFGVQALMQKIFSEFTFDAEATQVATPLVEVLERRRGVCQDFAHLMLACVRSRGLAARYVSGYLLTQPPPGSHA
jgi:transglutaminase-like putative cysteine protease